MAQRFEGKEPDSTRPDEERSAAPAPDVPWRELPSPAALVGLQRTIGNRAVAQLVRSRATTPGSPLLQRNNGTREQTRGASVPWEQILAGLLATLPAWLSAIVRRVATAMRTGELQLPESALMAALPVLTALARMGGGAAPAPGGPGAGAIVPHAAGAGAIVPHGGAPAGGGADGIGPGPWYSVAALLGTVVGADLRPIVHGVDTFVTGDVLAAAGLAHLIPHAGSLAAPSPPALPGPPAAAPLGLPGPLPPLGAPSPARSQFARSFPRREQLAADVFDAAAGNTVVALRAMTIFGVDVPANHEALVAVVALIARIADPLAAIQAIMAARPPLTLQQRQVAITIAGRPRNGGPAALDAYLKSTRAPAAKQAASVGPVAGYAGPSGHVIDDRHPINRALGMDGEHEQLRAHLDPLNRPYGLIQLTPLCIDLLATGAPAATVATLLRSLATHQPTLPRLNRASASVCAMLRVPALAPHADATLGAEPVLLSADGIAECIGLIARRAGPHTPALMISILQAIQPLAQPQRVVFLRRAEQPGPGGIAPALPNFAPGLTAAALDARIGSLTGLPPGGPGLTIQQANTELGSLDNSLNALVAQGTCSAGNAQILREVFQLVSTRWAAMQAFLNNAQVRAGLNQAGVRNSANWLRWFVTGHRGAPACADPGITRADPGGRNVVLTDWILNHVRQGHTFENFDFSDDNIDRSPTSTLFAAGITDNQIIADLQHIVDLCGGRPFNGNPINLGQYQVRIAQVPGGGAVRYRFTQFYMNIPIGFAQIPAAVLRLIRTIMGL